VLRAIARSLVFCRVIDDAENAATFLSPRVELRKSCVAFTLRGLAAVRCARPAPLANNFSTRAIGSQKVFQRGIFRAAHRDNIHHFND
jgi:hypothetical protein